MQTQGWNWLGGILLFSIAFVAGTTPGVAAPQPEENRKSPQVATTVREWLAQIEASTVQIVGIRVDRTDAELAIILETAEGQRLKVDPKQFRTEGNTLIAEVSNAVLVLPQGQSFRVDNPAPDIANVRIVQRSTSAIQVSVTGIETLPQTEVVLRTNGLTYSLNPTTDEAEEEEEIVATGDRQWGYVAPNASVGTRTNTPLRDIPQSIQVVPRQVLQDQAATSLTDALRNVSGVSSGTANSASISGDTVDPTIRGFNSLGNVLVDGTRRPLFSGGRFGLSNVEQIEVLKGPASVLYGAGEPGGTINVTRRQPQRNPAYELSGTVGNFSFLSPSLDLTGPLNNNKTILYRLNLNYENSGSFIDFVDLETFTISPILSFQLGRNTTLTLDGTYSRSSGTGGSGLPAVGTVLPSPFGEIPITRNLFEPNFGGKVESSYIAAGYRLDHRFNEDWSIRNRFLAAFATSEGRALARERLEDGRTYDRIPNINRASDPIYTLQTDLIGRVQTGSIRHELLFGVELSRTTFRGEEFQLEGDARFPLDLFAPEYGADIPPSSEFNVQSIDSFTGTNAIGVYAQNLISLGKQFKILLGGRFDWSETASEDKLANTSSYSSSTDFNPRIGIVYQPIEPVSLYGSWSRSTLPQTGTDREGNPFVPITGEQFEVGVRTELFNNRLVANLAAYQITRQNDFAPDPIEPDRFSIQIGERRSRGIELDLSGEPLPGLRLIASYAYTDALITEDAEGGNEGNRSANVPLHSGSLWAVYEIQKGTLTGFGFGAGVFLVGDRAGDLENTFDLPGYTRTDAVVYYRRDNWRVQLNVSNLFNVKYFEGSFDRDFVYPGAPFTVRGSLSVTF